MIFRPSDWLVGRAFKPWMRGDVYLARSRAQFFRDWATLRHRMVFYNSK